MIERTFVALKPDAVERGVTGQIISRFERAGLKIAAMKLMEPSKKLAEEHYDERIAEKHGEEVRLSLLEYIRGPVFAMVIEGDEAVKTVRKLVGNTYPNEARPGTIRGDFAHVSMKRADEQGKAVFNLIHASENSDDAEKEIELWFSEDEIHDYERSDKYHIV
ncbi:MAG: nucleoside-diphosphate kinase [Candidatus Aenigmatarchaeota archaeon]